MAKKKLTPQEVQQLRMQAARARAQGQYAQADRLHRKMAGQGKASKSTLDQVLATLTKKYDAQEIAERLAKSGAAAVSDVAKRMVERAKQAHAQHKAERARRESEAVDKRYRDSKDALIKHEASRGRPSPFSGGGDSKPESKPEPEGKTQRRGAPPALQKGKRGGMYYVHNGKKVYVNKSKKA